MEGLTRKYSQICDQIEAKKAKVEAKKQKLNGDDNIFNTSRGKNSSLLGSQQMSDAGSLSNRSITSKQNEEENDVDLVYETRVSNCLFS